MMKMTQRVFKLATLLASLSLPCHSFVSSAWYTGWHAQFLPPSQIPFSKYTSIQYAFAVTAQDGSISLAQSDLDTLNTLVPLAHSNGVNVSVSIGGWTGSKFFSTSFNSDQGRTSFVNDAVNLVKTLNLDGLDFDWEYPNRQGIGCNNISPQDSANFLTFLQELRGQLPTKTLSAAVFIEPFAGPDGNPMSDVSAFAKVLDHIEIMNYDIFVSSQATTRPNSPLDDSCAPSGSPGVGRGSATSAVKAWTSAGFPANQIVLGVAAYGHSWTVTPQNAFLSGGSSSSTTPSSSSPPSSGSSAGSSSSSSGAVAAVAAGTSSSSSSDDDSDCTDETPDSTPAPPAPAPAATSSADDEDCTDDTTETTASSTTTSSSSDDDTDCVDDGTVGSDSSSSSTTPVDSSASEDDTDCVDDSTQSSSDSSSSTGWDSSSSSSSPPSPASSPSSSSSWDSSSSTSGQGSIVDVAGAPSGSPAAATTGGPLTGLPQSVSQVGSAAAAFGLAKTLGGMVPYYVTPLIVLAALANAVPAPGPVPNLYTRDTSSDAAAPVLNVYAPAQVGQTPLGDSWDSTTGSTDVCGNFEAGPTGLFNFWGLIQQGFLDQNGNPNSGIAFTRDSCSQTPFVYDQTKQVMVSYDDPTSFAAKGSFIKSQGLKGFAMWELAGDTNNSLLLDAIRSTAL